MFDPTLYETDEIFEIWDGEMKMMTPSSPRHEEIISRLISHITSFVDLHKLGKIFSSNTAIHLSGDLLDKDFVMPDLTFISMKNKHLVKSNGIYGAPDLLVEVISPGLKNTRRDLIDKFQKYEQYGVREYWLVDPIGEDIEIHTLLDGKYKLVNESTILFGISVPMEKIFFDAFQDDEGSNS